MYYNQNIHNIPATYTKAQLDIMNYFRMLWEQHDVWTRSTITSLVFDLPNSDSVVERLLRNPIDFKNVLVRYYGEANANKFKELLTEHLIIAADIVKAVKIGDNNEATKAEKLWYTNADQIANLLGSINPYWNIENWRNMMYQHLDLVKKEAVAMLSGKYKDSVAVYDILEKQSLNMADVMAEGLIKQFQIR